MRRLILAGAILLVCAAAGMAQAQTPNGAQPREEWVARYEGFGDPPRVNTARGIAVDAAGNVYVTGASPAAGATDYATVKYDAAGKQLWAARAAGSAGGRDVATAIAVDAGGNVYVTGAMGGTGQGLDYVTVAYDAAGNELWAARFSGTGNGDDQAVGVAVGANGNVYVTGTSVISALAGSDYATVAYDAGGNELWVARYAPRMNSRNEAAALALDADGNIYVTGGSCIGGGPIQRCLNFDYATLKYDPEGNELWAARYDGPAEGSDRAYAIAVDAQGNVYVTGESCATGGVVCANFDYATLQYDANGTQLWAARYNGPWQAADQARAIAVDAAGNVTVTGQSCGVDENPCTNYDYATVSYDPAGNARWTARYTGPSDGHDFARAVALDAEGNAYVTGSSVTFGTGEDYATVKYASDGALVWAARFTGSGNARDTAYALALDSFGNVYLTGESCQDAPCLASDYATVKYAQK